MAGPGEVAFETDLAAAKEQSCLGLRDGEHLTKLYVVAGDIHAATTTARSRLY
jgi:hypothetical protein